MLYVKIVYKITKVYNVFHCYLKYVTLIPKDLFLW